MQWVKGNTDGFLQMLHRIIRRFQGKMVDLWVDNARWHKGPRVQAFLLEHSLCQIHYLPPYHPNLNYQERLWLTLRYEETTNTYFETIADLHQAVFKRSQRWKPKKIRQLCQVS